MAAIPCIGTIAGVRGALDQARLRGGSIGLVPTMGALHEGHLSLIRKARGENAFVVVSIFVNPTQFGAGEDLETYPRDLDRDLSLARDAGADLVFSPSAPEMYPRGFSTWIEVEGLTEGLCGASRPGHFRGVCTVVTKLIEICGPDRAYFGEKDAQQLAVIRRMARDLDLPVEIVPCPTVRESDGLALSSRNVRLSREERAQAPVLYRALSTALTLVENGERDAARLRDEICAVIGEAALAKIDYVEIVDADELASVDEIEGRCLIALAVWFGETRLIDNVTVRGAVGG
jgi:pantoate--beta-alanine ligase